MRELEKIRNVIQRLILGAPHEVLLVIDATNGQNAIRQAEVFTKSIGCTGVILTKLDGTAKGGVVVAVRQDHNPPVKSPSSAALLTISNRLTPIPLSSRCSFESDEFIHPLLNRVYSDDACIERNHCRFLRAAAIICWKVSHADSSPSRLISIPRGALGALTKAFFRSGPIAEVR